MKKLIKALALSCEKASELIDKGKVFELSHKERVLLRMHTGMCDACSAYQKQSEAIDHILQKNLQVPDENAVPQVVNEELKKKIISGL